MSANELQDWLEAGIAAAKAGEREKARALFMKVIEADEENEKAWLWLSGVVENDEDRRICLENVLTLNPDNKAAQKGMAKLGVSAPEANSEASETVEKYVVRREYKPLSLASAVLYPEQHVKEWRWKEKALNQPQQEKAYISTSSYDDIWSQEVDICAYCAQELQQDETPCPKCGRKLVSSRFRYENTGTSLVIFWVLLAGVGQLFLIQALFDIVIRRDVFSAVIDGFLMLTFFILAAGIYYRQPWAHWGSIFVSLLVLVIMLFNKFVPIDVSKLGLPVSDPAITTFAGSFLSQLGGFLETFEMVALGLSFFYAIYGAVPDFQKMGEWQNAKITKGISAADTYHEKAKQLVKEGKLASAVLHWQRAAAKQPHKIVYQRQLGLMYARLGFYERSLDMLQSALRLSTHPDVQAGIKRTIKAVEQLQQHAGSAPTKSTIKNG